MMNSYLVQILLVLLMAAGAKIGADALSTNYYGFQCPFLEPMVRNVVNQALRRDPTLAGGLLRLHFHDCFVQGCDASVLIDSTSNNTAEKESTANGSLRGYKVIDDAKELIERQCPGVVSCADIVALAAREAVFWGGGPYYNVATGRMDGRRSRVEDTVSLPPPTLNVSGLYKMFNTHGFNLQDLVALSGAHTLGVARCSSFKQRLSKFDSQNDVDPSLAPSFASSLARTCNAGDDSEVTFDSTRNAFDTNYFRALQRGMGVLATDQVLFADQQTQSLVAGYAMNQARFFFDFQQAMLKMGNIDVKQGNQGEIRQNCHRINH